MYILFVNMLIKSQMLVRKYFIWIKLRSCNDIGIQYNEIGDN